MVSFKKQIRRDQDNRCVDCGEKVKRLEIHHIVPKSMGGSDDPSNAIGLCGAEQNDCHKKWNRLAKKENIIYPGIPIEEAKPTQLKKAIIYKKQPHQLSFEDLSKCA